jgi:flagellar export protein FliJ
MKPFHFRLESLLRLREAARDARRVELAQSLAEQERLRVELEVTALQLAESRQKDRELRQLSTLSLAQLRQSESRRQALAAEQARITSATRAMAPQVDACQQDLATAECEYQAIARLRASRLMEHQREVVREESKLSDEAAGRAFRRAA